jgi:TP901 family phage tail tape measure protein
MVDFNVTLQAHLQGPSQAEIRNVAAGIQRGLDGVGARINIDAGSSAASLGRVAAGADAARAALRQAREQAQLMNASLSGTVSLGSQSAASLSNLAQQAGLAARRFVAMSVAAGVMVRIVQGFKDGVSAAVAFDLAMNKVQQATTETADKIGEIRSTISSLSTTLGVSSQGLADVALIAKSAGLSIKQTKDALEAVALTDLTPQFGSMKDTMNGLIAAFKQFHIESDQFKNVMGSINAVAAQFAVESQDIVEGVKKAGGAFSAVGGQSQRVQGLMTAVRGTTRESAEEIATGLRTIFTRLQRSDTVAALKDLGINLRYTRQEAEALNDTKLENQFVGAYEAVKRLSQGLDALKTTDPRYAAVVEQLGGYRQISRVIPLLKNFEDAERAKNVAIAGGISLQAAAEQRQEALANKLDRVKEQYLAAFRAITDTKGFQGMAEALTRVATLAKVLEYAAPLVPVLTALAAVKVAASIPSIVSNVSAAFNARVGAPLPPPTRRATGGLIPGSGNQDTVPALLTPGEFVITKAAAQRVGRGEPAGPERGRPGAGRAVRRRRAGRVPAVLWRRGRPAQPELRPVGPGRQEHGSRREGGPAAGAPGTRRGRPPEPGPGVPVQGGGQLRPGQGQLQGAVHHHPSAGRQGCRQLQGVAGVLRGRHPGPAEGRGRAGGSRGRPRGRSGPPSSGPVGPSSGPPRGRTTVAASTSTT